MDTHTLSFFCFAVSVLRTTFHTFTAKNLRAKGKFIFLLCVRFLPLYSGMRFAYRKVIKRNPLFFTYDASVYKNLFFCMRKLNEQNSKNRGDAKVGLFLRTTSTTRQVTRGASPSRVI